MADAHGLGPPTDAADARTLALATRLPRRARTAARTAATRLTRPFPAKTNRAGVGLSLPTTAPADASRRPEPPPRPPQRSKRPSALRRRHQCPTRTPISGPHPATTIKRWIEA
jgi:hypothetical protein